MTRDFTTPKWTLEEHCRLGKTRQWPFGRCEPQEEVADSAPKTGPQVKVSPYARHALRLTPSTGQIFVISPLP